MQKYKKSQNHPLKLMNLKNNTQTVSVIIPCLNEKNYIIPGLGDAGDLAFGSKL